VHERDARGGDRAGREAVLPGHRRSRPRRLHRDLPEARLLDAARRDHARGLREDARHLRVQRPSQAALALRAGLLAPAGRLNAVRSGPMNTLYFAPGACSFVPHAALEIVKAATGDEFEAKLVKLHKGEQKSPEYLALNPNGQVPLLVVDGKPLSQIVAICEYLDRRYPDIGFLPKDAWARAEALSMLAWMNNTVHPTFTHIFRPTDFTDDEGAQKSVRKHAVGKFRGML